MLFQNNLIAIGFHDLFIIKILCKINIFLQTKIREFIYGVLKPLNSRVTGKFGGAEGI